MWQVDRARRWTSLGCLALAVVVAGQTVAANGRPAPPDPHSIRLKAATFDPLNGTPAFPAVATVQALQPGVRGGYLVQFDRPITDADKEALKAAGATVKGYVPMMTLEVVMTEGRRAAVASLPGVRWVGVFQPGFKIRPGLLDVANSHFQPGENIRLQVSLFPGEDTPALSQIGGLGGQVQGVDQGRSYHVAYVEMPSDRLIQLSEIGQVRFIEMAHEFIELNDRSRFHTGMTSVADDTFTSGIDPSLDGNDEGSGFQVKYGHFDGGLHGAHADFSVPDLTFEPGSDSSDLDSGHGTHTAGSIVGDAGLWSSVPETPPQSGSVSPERWRGVTPQAALHHISFDNNYTDRQIFERESEEGAHISSNSWGYGNQFGSIVDYNTNAAIWDEGVWDADNDVAGLQDLTVFFSAGNGGGFISPYNGCTSAGPDKVGSPGTAKNVITVGNNETDRGTGNGCGPFSALGNNVEEMNASSSRGPVDPDGSGQGLFKPDITNIGGYWVMSVEAPGTASVCSGQTVSPDCPTDCSDTGANYAYNNGTSMSAPLTAGMGGALYQDLVVNRGESDPKPSLIKGMMINGARDLGPSACNYTFDVTQSTIHEGWGFVQMPATLYGPGGSPSQRNIDYENEVTGNAVGTGGTYNRQITATAGTPLKVTLVWTDYPAAAGSGSPLVVNDLDLEVSGPDGTFLGNNFTGNWSVTGGSADRYNVVENVYIQNPTGGTYTITVRGFQVSQDQEPNLGGTNQDYSLVWSGDLAAGGGPCAGQPAGTVCRASGGACDPQEVCDGISDACPADNIDPAGTVCRASTDSCDAAETCDGASPTCPADAAEPAGTVCRGPAGACDIAETCDGASFSCPADALAPTGTVCRAATGQCDLEEVCDGGTPFCPADQTEPNGTACDNGDPCAGDTCQAGVCEPVACGPAAQLEGDCLSVGLTPVTVNLAQSYVSPVVTTTVQYVNNTTPVVTRVSGVTPTSFDVHLQAAGSGGVSAENVCYLVVEEGTWNIDGVNIEAQTYLSSVTDENNSWVGEAQAYGQAYTTPVVLGQVMSENDADWSVFWDQGTSRTNPPIASTLVTGKTVCEDTLTSRADETVGFVVIEAGHGTIGGIEFEAALGADSVEGVGNSPPYAYNFNTAFGSAPQVRVATLAGMDGGNGGWAYIHGTTGASATQLFLSVDEDTIGDSERVHITEQIGYVAFESAVVYPPVGGGVCAGQPAGTVCRASTGACDPEEVCDGVSDTCPADNVEPGGTICRASAGACDVAEVCDGVSGTCPADSVVSGGTVCRASTDSCDATETCDGASPVCPADGAEPAGTVCRGAAGACDLTETCDGSSFSCPADVLVPAGTVCRASVDQCDAEETCDGGTPVCPPDLSEPNGTACDNGDACSGDTCQAGVCEPVACGPSAQLETTCLSVGSNPVSVPLGQTYVSPVVVCSAAYSNNVSPIVTRVTNVTGTGFDVRLQNPGDLAAVDAENVCCMIVEEGTWTIDGVDIEAQTYLSTVTAENNNWIVEAQSYGQRYTEPVVIGQVMSENDPEWSVFWDQGNARTNPPTAEAVATGKTVCEDSITARNDEVIGFIVIEAGHGTIGGVEFEAAVGADSVRGVSNAPPYNYTFNTAFGSTPQVFLVTMAAMDGNNGGWAYAFGASPLSATTLSLVIDEDQIQDSERAHTPEQVGYIVFGSNVSYP